MKNNNSPTILPLPPERSKDLNLLASALAKAQGNMGEAERNSRNDFIGSTYADLTSVIEAIRKPLAEQGLSISQSFVPQAEGATLLSTMILHESGQFLRGFLPLLNVKDYHSLGSAISYARRYSINSMLGVCPEGSDDDGETAMGRGRNRKARSDKGKARVVKNPPTQDGVSLMKKILDKVPGGEDYLRGVGVDPGDPPANIREKIISLGSDGLEKKIAEQRKKEEEAEEIVEEADKVEPVDEKEVAA